MLVPATCQPNVRLRQPLLTSVCLATLLLILLAPTAGAQVEDPTGAEAQELADLYSPIFMLAEQSADCDIGGEAFAPMPVDVILDNPDVLLRQAGEADPVVTRSPVASDLNGRGLGFYLDFNGLALEAECVYEFDYNRYTQGQPSAVYAHIVQQADHPGVLALQYWSFWYFNDWNNKHESDWEFIQILFEAESISEALASKPISVGYAQHEGGEGAAWETDKLTKSGTHPVVYSSTGSHASYFASTYYLGRKGTEGFGCDSTEGPSVEVVPEVILLPDRVNDPDDPLAWLNFQGRWGERHSGPFDGPTGPSMKDQWTSPVDWSTGLRSKSVSLPVAELGNSSTITKFCQAVDFTSNQYRAAKVSPVRILVIGAILLAAVRLLIALTDWGRVPTTPLVRRRRLGQILRTAGASHLSSSGAILSMSLVYIPVALLISLVGWGVSLRYGQLVAAIAGPILYVSAIMGASYFWSKSTARTRPSVAEIHHHTRSRLTSVLLTHLMAAGIIALLSLTIVGIPLAIRQFIRYQFTIPVSTLEGLSGAAALKRSSELVKGRWWYTAIVIVVMNGLLIYINLLLSLALLIVLAGIPLWVFLGLSFAAWGLFVPMVATAPVLLYGDAVAEERGYEHKADEKISMQRARRLAKLSGPTYS